MKIIDRGKLHTPVQVKKGERIKVVAGDNTLGSFNLSADQTMLIGEVIFAETEFEGKRSISVILVEHSDG